MFLTLDFEQKLQVWIQPRNNCLVLVYLDLKHSEKYIVQYICYDFLITCICYVIIIYRLSTCLRYPFQTLWVDESF